MAWPHGSVVEHQSMSQEAMAQFLVRAHAWIVDSVPSRGCAGGSQPMILSIIIGVSISLSPFVSEINKNMFKSL